MPVTMPTLATDHANVSVAIHYSDCLWWQRGADVTIDGSAIDVDFAMSRTSGSFTCPYTAAAVFLGRLLPGRYTVSSRMRWTGPGSKMLLSHEFPAVEFEVHPAGGELDPPIAIEFVNASRTRYMVTTDPGEIGSLDRDPARTWRRTGMAFPTVPSDSPGAAPVCRYYAEYPGNYPYDGIEAMHYFRLAAPTCPSEAEVDPYARLESSAAFYVYPMPGPIPTQSPQCPSGTDALSRSGSSLGLTNERVVPRDGAAGQQLDWREWTLSDFPMCVPQWKCKYQSSLRTYDCQP